MAERPCSRAARIALSGLLLGVDWSAEEEKAAEQECTEQVWVTEFAWGHEEIVAGIVRVTNP